MWPCYFPCTHFPCVADTFLVIFPAHNAFYSDGAWQPWWCWLEQSTLEVCQVDSHSQEFGVRIQR